MEFGRLEYGRRKDRYRNYDPPIDNRRNNRNCKGSPVTVISLCNWAIYRCFSLCYSFRGGGYTQTKERSKSCCCRTSKRILFSYTSSRYRYGGFYGWEGGGSQMEGGQLSSQRVDNFFLSKKIKQRKISEWFFNQPYRTN